MVKRERVKCEMCGGATTRPAEFVVGRDGRVRLCPGCVVHLGGALASLALDDELGVQPGTSASRSASGPVLGSASGPVLAEARDGQA